MLRMEKWGLETIFGNSCQLAIAFSSGFGVPLFQSLWILWSSTNKLPLERPRRLGTRNKPFTIPSTNLPSIQAAKSVEVLPSYFPPFVCAPGMCRFPGPSPVPPDPRRQDRCWISDLRLRRTHWLTSSQRIHLHPQASTETYQVLATPTDLFSSVGMIITAKLPVTQLLLSVRVVSKGWERMLFFLAAATWLQPSFPTCELASSSSFGMFLPKFGWMKQFLSSPAWQHRERYGKTLVAKW